MEPSELTDSPRPASSRRDDLFVIAVFVAVFALLTAVVGAGWAWRAIDESKANLATQGATAAPATVTLKEFSVSAASVAAGGALSVVNGGTAVHNLTVEGTDLKTPDIAGGATATLELGDLAPGAYTMFCAIPGHKDAGMTAELTVTAAGGADSATATTTGHDMDTSGGGQASFDKMTKDMLATMGAFPAKTAGLGNAALAPTEVAADGTKVFDLTMEQANWEVSPGKVVKAWTFNGIVPGPKLDLQVGDKVKVRVKNDLPIATDVHWHGLNVDNANDGVAPLTQALIEPGATFTYAFTTDEPAVAMYHPHAHGHLLLPDGMFGVILVGDMALPAGRTVGYTPVPADVKVSQEIPMVLNDAGVIGYSLNGKSFPATAPISAKVGDWIEVHYFNEGTQIHPMHLHQFDQLVIAKDGFPVPEPYAVDTLNVAPGERYTVLIKVDKAGAWVWHCHILPHVESTAGMYGMVTAIVAT